MSTIESTKPLTYLPLKYAKYAHYLYWVLQRVRNSEDTPEFTSAFEVISKKLYEETMMFSYDFPEQNAFYDLFISQEKDAAKAINDAKPKKKRTRKAKPIDEQEQATSEDKKPEIVKEKKEKAPPKEVKEKVVKEKVVKEKKEKKVDSLESNSNTDIIAQIVSRANSVDSDIVPEVDKKELDKQKKEREIVEKKEKKEREDKERKEKKERENKEKKEKKEREEMERKEKKDKKERELMEKKEKKEKAPPKEKVVKEKVVKEKVVKEKVVKEKVVKEKVVKEKNGNDILNEITEELVADFINTLGSDNDNDSEIILVDDHDQDHQDEHEEQEEEEDIQVIPVTINGTLCNQDSNGNLYSIIDNSLIL